METLIVDALACHRITRLITQDVIFDRPRNHTLAALHAAGYLKAKEALRCPFCVSVYVGFGVVAARAVVPRLWGPVGRALALSDVAGILAAL